MKHQVLFSLKNDENMFMNVACCSCDRHFKGQISGEIRTAANNNYMNSLAGERKESVDYCSKFPPKQCALYLKFCFLLLCCFMSIVNIYDHVGTVSQPNHTFPGQA